MRTKRAQNTPITLKRKHAKKLERDKTIDRSACLLLAGEIVDSNPDAKSNQLDLLTKSTLIGT